MKKTTYLSVLLAFAITPAISQSPIDSPQPEKDAESSKIRNLNGALGNDKAPKSTTSWFNYFRDLANQGATTVNYRTSLFPDSTVLVQNGSDFDYAFKHSYGQVLDPTSSLHETPIRDFATYSLDTIGLTYRYFRPQTDAADTLVISIFRESDLGFTENPGWSTPRSYASVPYDINKLKGENPSNEIIYLLEEKDRQEDANGDLFIPVNMDLDAGEIIAVTFTYFPGNVWNPGDTLANTIATFGPQTRNCLNTFDGRDESLTLDNGFYNHGLWATQDIRYNDTANTNGWEGQYVPGVAYGISGGVRHMNVDFMLTFEDFTGINELGKEYNFNVSPNPFNTEVTFSYDVKPSDRAQIELYDVLGKQVQNVVLNTAAKKQLVDVSELAGGIYFAKLIVNNTAITSSKIIKE